MLKIGLFATGLDTYWGQFDGLRDNLDVYRRTIVDCINSCGDDVECVDAGMVDSPEKALAAARYFNEEHIEMVFLYVATYCLSSTVLPIAQRLKCPVILLNLKPETVVSAIEKYCDGFKATFTASHRKRMLINKEEANEYLKNEVLKILRK